MYEYEAFNNAYKLESLWPIDVVVSPDGKYCTYKDTVYRLYTGDSKYACAVNQTILGKAQPFVTTNRYHTKFYLFLPLPGGNFNYSRFKFIGEIISEYWTGERLYQGYGGRETI